MKHRALPRLPFAVFRWFCRPSYHTDIEGDLIQHYERNVDSIGSRRAYWRLWKDVIRLFRPGIIKPIAFNTGNNPTDMLRHNILVSFRNFMRYKTSFFINLFGLSTGLACVLLIFLWVNDEVSIDSFHESEDRLYQVLEHVQQNGGITTRESTSGPMAALLASELPEVEMALSNTARWNQGKVLTVGAEDINASCLFSDEPFFRMFSYKLIEGKADQVLKDKLSIVISRKLAVTFFGAPSEAIGKSIQLDHKTDYQVTGVMEDVSNSSFRFDFVLNFAVFRDVNPWMNNWGGTSPQTYVLLKEGTDADALGRKIVELVRSKSEGATNHRTQFLQKVSDRYLYGRYENGMAAGGRIEYVRLFSIIAVFILIIACMNFMNLSTARASRRTKEVGIKKSVGAPRWSLVSQFLAESTLIAVMSLAVSIILALLLLPQFNLLTGKNLSLDPGGRLLWFIPAVALATGLVAGSYPALYLSKFRPALVLKGRLPGSFGEAFARKWLVVFQFTASIILIVCVVVVYKQIEFTQTKDLGYKKDNVLLISRGPLKGKEEVFINEVKKMPGVIGATASSHDMTGHESGTWGLLWPGKDLDDKTEFERFHVRPGMIELLGIQVIEGRSISDDAAAEENSIIFNETAIKYMGITDPIGKQVEFMDGNKKRTIVGVVKDFNFESLHEPFKPIYITHDPGDAYVFMVKFEGGREAEVISSIENFYSTMNPGFPFSFRFLDDDYQRMYSAELRVAKLSQYFAGLAIMISCLGLFGLAAFTAERRLKEIGIRKVLGAGNSTIVLLLSEEFTKVMLIALVIALPVSWLMANSWLEGFKFRIELQWWFFVLSGLVAILIAWLAVSFQTIRAARVNPIACLKTE